MSDLSSLLSCMTPYVVAAGDYAATIQSRVASRPSKDQYSDPFSQALTDADLSVQTFIEVALLSHFPDLSFYGEEADSSLNMKYFSRGAGLTVLLDPVDGTLFYRDNKDGFNVILTVCDKDGVCGSLCYVPRRGVLFRAAKGRGAFSLSREAALRGETGQPLKLNTGGNLVITFDFPELPELLGSEFTVFDIRTEYSRDRDCPNMNEILLGGCSAVIFKRGGVIDLGALGFIAQEAGGCFSNFDGAPLKLPEDLSTYPRYERPLLCSSPGLHQMAIKSLKGSF